MMHNYEIQLAYDEYCEDCYWEGVTPKPIWEWWKEEELSSLPVKCDMIKMPKEW